jgi:hypothetical protein
MFICDFILIKNLSNVLIDFETIDYVLPGSESAFILRDGSGSAFAQKARSRSA